MLRFISVHHKKKNQNNSQMCVVFSRPRHKELEHVEECPLYIISRGIRSGCRFTGTSLPLFTDINLCVNGSSPEGPLRPHLISLQIQNHGTYARTHARTLALRRVMGKRFGSELFSPCHCFRDCVSSEASDHRESVCARRPRQAGNKLGASCGQGARRLPGMGGGTPS